MSKDETNDAKHDWLIEILVNMVCYTSANNLAVISEELTSALVVLSQELDRPIRLGDDLEYIPPREKVVVSFRSKYRKPEYEH